MAQLLSTGTVRYAYVGITTEDLTPSIAKKFGYAAKRGALIDAVTNGQRRGPRRASRPARTTPSSRARRSRSAATPSSRSTGCPVTNAEDVVRIVSERLLPGETVPFTVVRGGQRRVVRVTLGERPAKAG